jgi:hypothetical protein
MAEMFLLPRGITVKENVNPQRVNLPEALEKLRSVRFSGYLRFGATKGTGILIFYQGGLVGALFEGEKNRLLAMDAIARIFELSLQGGVTLDVYRLSDDLALRVNALLRGKVLSSGRELEGIDVRLLLRRVKEARLNGCLRVYAGDRSVLIFYRDGQSLGFFHDGGKELETSADLSGSVARLPGARLDVLQTAPPEGTPTADLLEANDLKELWKKTKMLQTSTVSS